MTQPNLYAPDARSTGTLTAAQTATITFPRVMGRMYIQNVGPGIVYVRFDATLPSGVAGTAGQITLASGQCYNLDNVGLTDISVYSVTTSRVECVGIISSGK